MIIIFVIFVGSFVVIDLYQSSSIKKLNSGFSWLTSVGGVSGLVVLFLGKASSTAAIMRERFNTWTNLGATVISGACSAGVYRDRNQLPVCDRG